VYGCGERGKCGGVGGCHEIRFKKANQSHYRPEAPKGFQEIKVPRLCDNGPVWW